MSETKVRTAFPDIWGEYKNDGNPSCVYVGLLQCCVLREKEKLIFVHFEHHLGHAACYSQARQTNDCEQFLLNSHSHRTGR
jgi:hypothetical protein